MNNPANENTYQPEEQPVAREQGEYIPSAAAPPEEKEQSRRLRSGYRATEGDEEYGEVRNGTGEPPGGVVSAETGFDPTHSGVQPAKNIPGEQIETPGRDTGTAWGENKQMGKTTDRPNKENPEIRGM